MVKFSSLSDKIQNMLLKKKQDNPDFNIEKYLNPNLDDLNNPFDLNGMSEAVNRIEKAI